MVLGAVIDQMSRIASCRDPLAMPYIFAVSKKTPLFSYFGLRHPILGNLPSPVRRAGLAMQHVNSGPKVRQFAVFTNGRAVGPLFFCATKFPALRTGLDKRLGRSRSKSEWHRFKQKISAVQPVSDRSMIFVAGLQRLCVDALSPNQLQTKQCTRALSERRLSRTLLWRWKERHFYSKTQRFEILT